MNGILSWVVFVCLGSSKHACYQLLPGKIAHICLSHCADCQTVLANNAWPGSSWIVSYNRQSNVTWRRGDLVLQLVPPSALWMSAVQLNMRISSVLNCSLSWDIRQAARDHWEGDIIWRSPGGRIDKLRISTTSLVSNSEVVGETGASWAGFCLRWHQFGMIKNIMSEYRELFTLDSGRHLFLSEISKIVLECLPPW